jgi:hypothetical protein
MPRDVGTDWEVDSTDWVPERSRVRHFDELDEAAQEFLIQSTEGATARDPRTVPDLREGDVVVFTEYYHVGGA